MALLAQVEAALARCAADRRPGRPPTPADAAGRYADFRALLKAHRDARRWSQERLALEAAVDHSLLSRLESGGRNPTREAVGKLATGLGLDRERAEHLLLSAGFLPDTIDAGDLRRALAVVREVGAAELAAVRQLIELRSR